MYTTYDYLKEDPQVRHPLITTNWAKVFTSKDIPIVVRQELKEMAHDGIQLTDANLFWHKQQTIDILDGRYTPIDFNSPLLEQFYTIVQLEGFNDAVVSCCNLLLKQAHNIPAHIKLTLKEWHKIVNFMAQPRYNNYQWQSTLMISTLIVSALADINYNDLQLNCIRNLSIMMHQCSRRFIESMDSYVKINEVCQLIGDTGNDKIYNSMNELEADHDRVTAAVAERMAAKYGITRFSYHPIFMEIVKENGFTLPKSPADMVLRGQKHSNCVGTYVDRQQIYKPASGNIKRIIFGSDVTMDLDLKIRHDKVVATIVQQYKGRYNKDHDIPESVTALQIALTGISVKCLKVEVIDAGTSKENQVLCDM